MALLWFLLFLVPIHLLTGMIVSGLVQYATQIDPFAEQWIIAPAYVLFATAVSTLWLDRFVIPPQDKVEFFRTKVFLGSMSWASFLIWAKLLVTYQGYMTAIEADFTSAALLVFGTAVMIQYWWTNEKPANRD